MKTRLAAFGVTLLLAIGLVPAFALASTNVYTDDHYFYVVGGSEVHGLGNVTVKGMCSAYNTLGGSNLIEFCLYKGDDLIMSNQFTPSLDDLKNGKFFSWTFSIANSGYGSYRVTFGNKQYDYNSSTGDYDIDYMGGIYETTFVASAAPVAPAVKKANPLTVKAKTVTFKAAKVKRAKQSVKASKAFTVKKAKGKVTYKAVKSISKNAMKWVKVAKNGRVAVKKGAAEGTYKLKVKVTAAGNDAYKSKSKTVKLVVKVK